MPFFVTGLVGLVLLHAGIALDPAALRVPPGTSGILLLHLTVLGWITPTMMGADYQLLPVVLHQPLPRPGLARAVLAVYVVGTALFLFAWGTGTGLGLALGGALAGLGLLGFVAHMTAALVRTRSGLGRGPVAIGLVGGLGFLSLTAVLGPWMALGLGGIVPQPFSSLRAMHAAAGLAGWLLLTVLGASYQLLPFFAATPTTVRPRWGVWAAVLVALGALGLVAAGLGLLPAWAAGLTTWTGLSLWLWDLVALAARGRQARREPVTLYTLLAAVALWLGASGGLAALAGWRGPWVLPAYVGLIVGPALLVLGQLQKILPFIAALDVSLAARRHGAVPKTEALFPRQRAFAILAVLGPAYLATVLGLAAHWPVLIRAGAALAALAVLGHALQQLRALRAWRRAAEPEPQPVSR